MYDDLQFTNKEVILTGTDYIKTVVICPLIRFIECQMQSPEGVLLEKRSEIFVKIHIKHLPGNLLLITLQTLGL